MYKFILVLIVLCTCSAYTQLLDSAQLTKKKLYMSFADGFMNKDDCYKLCQGGQGLDKIPQDIKYLQKLQEINLSQNYITELPEELCQLTNLTEVKLGTNELTQLPDCFEQLTNLERLDLSNNPKINWEKQINIIFNLKNLQYLDLSYNDIKKIPDEITNLVSLKELALYGNSFTVEEKKRLVNILPNVKIMY